MPSRGTGNAIRADSMYESALWISIRKIDYQRHRQNSSAREIPENYSNNIRLYS